MASFDFENPAFEPENLDDVDDTTQLLSAEGPTAIDDATVMLDVGDSTRLFGADGMDNITLDQFIDSIEIGEVTDSSMRLLKSAVDDYYNVQIMSADDAPIAIDPNDFMLLSSGELRLKKFPEIPITNTTTKAPLALSTIARKLGGLAAVRRGLGYTEYPNPTSAHHRELPPQAVEALGVAKVELDKTITTAENVELADLGQVAQDVSDTVTTLETSFNDANGLTSSQRLSDNPSLALREIRGLDATLQTIRGELVNNLAKLRELDEHIAVEKQKIAEVDETENVDEPTKRRLRARLRDLEDERTSRLEAASTTRELLRSQIMRIRETVTRILNEDTTLAARLRTLFREQGITIVSILTAVGMAISTLVLALTGSAATVTPTPPPPTDKGGVKQWIKKHLQNLGQALSRLAGRAAAALPGILGSIAGWLLTFLATVIGWVATNLWTLVVAVVGFLLLALRDWLAGRKKAPKESPKKPES